MDDNELDKLFGMDNESEEESSETKEVSEDSTFVLDEEKLEEDKKAIKEEESDSDSDEEEPTATIVEEEEEKPEPEEKKPETVKKTPVKPQAKVTKIKKEKKSENKKSIKDIVGNNLTMPDVDISIGQIVLVLVAILFVVAIILFFTLPQFRVRNVKIDGNIVLSDEQVLEEAGLKANSHLISGVSGNIFDYLTFNYGKTEERMKRENPYYKDVKVSISLPSTVHIQVEERAKVSYVRTPDGYVALDKEGVILEMSSKLEDYQRVRPVICGLEMSNAVLGQKIKFKDEIDYQKAIIVLGAILAADANNPNSEYSMFAHTNELRIIPSGYIFLTFETPTGNTLQVKLNGVENISEDMTWLLYAINVNAFDSLPDGALDMTGDEYVYRDYGFSRNPGQ